MRINRLTKILTWIFILYTLHTTLYASTAFCASKGNYPVTKHVIARSEATKQSLRLLRLLRSLAMTVDNWLCQNAYAASKGNPPIVYWRFDEGGGGTTYDESLLSNNFYELRYDIGKSFFRNFTDSFADKPFVHSNNFAKLYNRRLREPAGFLVRTSQDKVKVVQFRCYMRRYSCYDNIAGRIIEFIRRDNNARPLFDGCKVSEWKGNEDNLTLLISYHRQNLQDCPRSQRTFPLISERTYQHGRFSEAAAVLSGVFAGVPQEIFESPVQLLLKMGSLSFTSITKSTIIESKCQGELIMSGVECESARSWTQPFGCYSNHVWSSTRKRVSHVIARSEATKQSLRLLRSLRSLAMTMDNWLCPNVYAASKGNPPVAYWRFDEGGGPTAYDESTNNNDGTLTAGAGGTNTAVGQMWTRQGKISGALELDGTDDYVSLGNVPATLTEGTIEIWFNRRTSKSGYQMLFTDAGSQFEICYNTDTLQFYVDNVAVNTTSANNNGTWQHVTGTFSQTGNYKRLYLNGVLVGSGTYTGDATVAARYIGSRIGSLPFDGFIDDVKVYDYARTADQILVDYNAGTAAYLGAGTDPNEGNPPVGYWKFDENTGTIAYDRSGNGNNGTLNDNTTWTYGKKGSGVIFDGNGDWVSIADSSTLDSISSTGTIEAWINLSSLPSNGSTDSNLYAIASGHTSAYLEIYNYSALTTYPRIGLWRSTPTNVWTLGATNLTGMTGQWLHIASTWDTTGAKIYLNGQLDGSDSNGGTAGIVGASGFGIGRNPEVTRYFNGKIDDVKIYSYARTHAQIAYDYNKGKPVAHYKFDEGGGTISHNEYSSADTGAAPVGWWRMDTASSGSANGASIADSSGNANNGTATYGANLTGMNWTTGKIGPGALDFDGVDDRVDLGNKSIVDGLAGVTVTAWINVPVLNAGHHRVFSEENLLYVGHYGNQVSFYMDAVGGSWSHSSTAMGTLTAGQWQFVAWVKDGTTGRVYIDGVQIATMSAPATLGTTSNANYLGTYTGLSQYWDGKMDDVRIYNYARTAEQIYNDYKTTHGALVGSNIKFVDGKIGKAVEFNGTNDQIVIGKNDILSGATAATWEAWVKPDALSSWKSIITSWNDPSSHTWVFDLYNDGLALHLKTVGDSDYPPDYKPTGLGITTGVWQHVACTYDGNAGSSHIKFYVNGILKTQYNKTNVGTVISSGTTDLLKIGVDRDTTAPFDGQIDDIKVYNYARTTEQVMQDYNEGKSVRLGSQSAGVADPWGGALPVGHWKLDENTGVLAKDASGNGNNGTLTNGPTWVQGKVGSALSFDGTNDYVDAGNNANLSTGSQITLEAWIYPREFKAYSGIIDKYHDGNYEYFLEIYNTSGELTFRIRMDDVWTTLDSVPGLTLNNWQHVVATWNGSVMKVFINGIEKGSRSASGTTITATDRHVRIGSGWSDVKFNGLIDDARIYNYARTQAQIAWDYNKGKPVGYWRFDEAVSGAVSTSAGAIKDESDNNSDGTASNTTWTYTTGKFGGALNFGGDDYVSVSSLTGIPQGNDIYTISAWIKPNAMGSEGIAGWGTWGTTNAVNAFRLHSGGLVNYWWGNDLTVSTADLSGAWHHVVALFDGTTRKIYVDSVLKGSDTPTGHNAVLSNFRLGSTNSGEYFNGLIDDVRIYNYARTQDQIVQDYNQGLAAKMGE